MTKKSYIALLVTVCLVLAAPLFMGADATYTTGFYVKQGGDDAIVASGGTMTVESGGTFTGDSGSTFSIDDLTVADELTVTDDATISGVLQAKYLPVTSATQTVTLTTASAGKIIYNSTTATTTWTLPDAAAGLWYMFAIDSATAAVNIDPQAGDQILSICDSTGDKISNTGTAGDSVCLYAIDGVDWIVLSSHGTWSDGN